MICIHSILIFQTESQLHSRVQTAKGIKLYVNAGKTELMGSDLHIESL